MPLRICLGVLIICCLGAAFALPLMAWRDSGLAESRHRSVYSKCAGQGATLAFLLQIFMLVLFVMDSLFKGALISALQSDPGRLMWDIGLLGLGLAALFGIFYLLEWGGRCMALLSSLCALLPAFISLVLFGHYLHAGALPLSMNQEGLGLTAIFSKAGSLMLEDMNHLLPVLVLLTFPFLAMASAEGLALIWTLTRRKREDFGRDYYNFALGYRARRAAYSSAWLLPLAGVMLWLAPWPVTMPLADLDSLTVTIVLNVCVLGLPLAVYCWYSTLKSSAPLRCKTAICLALPLFWLGLFGLFGRLMGA